MKVGRGEGTKKQRQRNKRRNGRTGLKCSQTNFHLTDQRTRHYLIKAAECFHLMKRGYKKIGKKMKIIIKGYGWSLYPPVLIRNVCIAQYVTEYGPL